MKVKVMYVPQIMGSKTTAEDFERMLQDFISQSNKEIKGITAVRDHLIIIYENKGRVLIG